MRGLINALKCNIQICQQDFSSLSEKLFEFVQPCSTNIKKTFAKFKGSFQKTITV